MVSPTKLGAETTIDGAGSFSVQTALSDGRTVVVSVSEGVVYASYYSASGVLQGPPDAITTLEEYNPDTYSLKSFVVEGTTGGGFTLSYSYLYIDDFWLDPRNGEQTQIFDSTGDFVNSISGSERFSDDHALASDGDGHVLRIAYDYSDRTFHSQVFSEANGFATSTASTFGNSPSSSLSDPSADAVGDGYVVTWTTTTRVGSSINGQLLDASGKAVAGGSFSIATSGTNSSVVALDDGRFVVTWTGVDASQTGVHGQLYSATGGKIGDDFIVNTETSSTQSEASVTELSDGSFVVVWTDASGLGGDASGTAIKAQVFNENGARRGDEFLVNTEVAGSQFSPNVSAASGQRFVISWRSDDGDIHSQSFDAANLPNDMTPPTIDGLSVDTVAENAADRTIFSEVLATDADTGPGEMRFALVDDAGGRFTIGAGSGAIRVADGLRLDYEQQTSFVIRVRVTDKAGNSSERDLTIHLSDVSPETVKGDARANLIVSGDGADYLDGGDGADTLRGGDGADTLFGGAGLDSVVGGGGADTMRGGDGADTLEGGEGADTIDGGAGLDRMVGGGGDDIFYVDQTGDVVVEAAGGGVDQVRATTSYTLSANVENLALYGSANIDAIGNNLANQLNGNSGDNLLDGKAGADLMRGFAGNDTYVVDNGGDVVVEAANAGIDTVRAAFSYTLGANLENLVLTGSAAANGAGNALDNAITGNGAANTLRGNDGADTLDGGGGADNLIGGSGDDRYVVDNVGDVVTESANQGVDTVVSTVNWTLGANVENLILNAGVSGIGNALDNRIIGNLSANTLIGNGGADTLDGGGGGDNMIGGAGDDTYYVDDVNDVVTEAANEGADRVISASDYTLGANVENLTLSGIAAIDGTGNGLANSITGNAGANTLSGMGGADVLNGGLGADVLVGGAGADTFRFSTAIDGVVNVDTISDFNAVDDTIQLAKSVFGALSLGALNANAFVIGTQAADASDRIIYNSSTGALLYDADGAGGATAIRFATLGSGLSITADDFRVI